MVIIFINKVDYLLNKAILLIINMLLKINDLNLNKINVLLPLNNNQIYLHLYYLIYSINKLINFHLFLFMKLA